MTINKKYSVRLHSRMIFKPSKLLVTQEMLDLCSVLDAFFEAEKKWRRGLPRGMHFALVYCPISEGMGVKIVNSDSGFPRGRGDTKSAVIRGWLWIFFGISQFNVVDSQACTGTSPVTSSHVT